MGRPSRAPEPEVVERQSGGAEADLWAYLRTLGSRLSIGQAHGFAVEVANEWLRLDSTRSPCLEKVSSLRRFAIERGSRERDVDRVIEHARRHVADGVWRTSQDRRDELRRRLIAGAA